VISSFDLGYPKEDLRFWRILQERLAFDPDHTLLADDNVDVLTTARRYGLKYIFFKAKSSSQLPPATNSHFPAILSFQELMV
jgi:putative hydrolase of the HAD superfamily